MHHLFEGTFDRIELKGVEVLRVQVYLLSLLSTNFNIVRQLLMKLFLMMTYHRTV